MTQNTEIISEKDLKNFCTKWKIKNLYYFGSILTPNFEPLKSDLDVMVEFETKDQWSLFDHVEMRDELSKLSGLPVDLVTFDSIKRSQNQQRRESILSTAKLIYQSRSDI